MTNFDNPEISAMDRISRILQDLPDDAARLRVMRWSFSKFSPEFQRPVGDATSTPASPPAPTPMKPAAPIAPAASTGSQANAPGDTVGDDFTRQVAELKDFFGQR